MRWSKLRRLVAPASGRLSRGRLVRAAIPLIGFTTAILLASTLLLFSSPEEKRISIYSNAANYGLPVLDRNGDEYIGLLELFEPLGAVSAKANGSHWKFRYYDVESDFTAGQARARIRGSDFDLPASFLLEKTKRKTINPAEKAVLRDAVGVDPKPRRAVHATRRVTPIIPRMAASGIGTRNGKTHAQAKKPNV